MHFLSLSLSLSLSCVCECVVSFFFLSCVRVCGYCVCVCWLAKTYIPHIFAPRFCTLGIMYACVLDAS